MLNDKYHKVFINDFINNRGFTSISESKTGELTHTGMSLPGDDLIYNTELQVNGVPFFITKDENNLDNIELEGQLVPFKITTVKRIHFLSLSCYGSYFQNLNLFNDEVVVDIKPFYTTELINKQPAFEKVRTGLFFDYVHNKKGKVTNLTGTIWHSEIDLAYPKKINAVLFEDNPAIHVFAITLECEVE
ncbi:hypothetical protein PQ478_21625 (plasmid) [Alkalihalophilus pseudofirmus]|uniref:hypothetical protein n=1 Tax=Alkalihalophilus pseudofirmus TaxID=79885 RepID=UPI00259BBE59|nr:hypothetical protein [Alkalihalophilus pseudofirmus]WEG19158.1 hypothetical protein PQ478_21625 [Alkalihalophilus pseudofirmus]